MKTYIIAEAGLAHGGDINTADLMISIAKGAGADAIKFQDVQELAGFEGYILPKHAFRYLKRKCQEIEIEFMCTPFSLASIDRLNDLGMKIWKIPSGEITNLPYLKKIGNLHKEIILSTGMSEMSEIVDAISILVDCGAIIKGILHCTSAYPVPYKDCNLLAIPELADTFGYPIGYSDHTLGYEVSLAAVVFGAEIIEKHFIINRNFEAPDAQIALEPQELKEMIQKIRNIEKALGTDTKQCQESERSNLSLRNRAL